jgi:hypothetical protein
MAAFLWFTSHIMDLVNRAIQYDRRCAEKPFLLDRHALFGLTPSFKAAPHPCGNAAWHHPGSVL